MAKNTYDVCIIGGCGHVGLPLSIALATKGKKVCIYDINEASVKTVGSGQMPFWEDGAEPLLKQVLHNNTLTLSTRPEVISESAILILIIGTPVDEHLNPKFGLMKKIIDEYSSYFREDQLLILRSTVYPGISAKINNWILEKGKKVHLAFCPERILEGKSLIELESLPQIVSSFTEEGLKRSIELFKVLTDDIIILEPMEAELTKLFTNVWRYIRFAIANQFYMIANDYDLDFYKIYHGMTHNYPRAKDLPKPGFAAGPCLFKDTMQLAAFNNNSFYLGHAAMLINEGLPNYVMQKVKKKHNLANMTVGILGMAFKGDSDDIRESLSFKLKKIFEIEAKSVLCSDPMVNDENFVSTEELIARSDMIILATPHSAYKNLAVPEGKIVVDVWNLLQKGGII